MAVTKKSRKKLPKSSACKQGSSPYKAKSIKTRKASHLREIRKISADTIMELTSKFLCEDHDFSGLRGLEAIELIFVVQALLFVNLEEMNRQHRQENRKN